MVSEAVTGKARGGPAKEEQGGGDLVSVRAVTAPSASSSGRLVSSPSSPKRRGRRCTASHPHPSAAGPKKQSSRSTVTAGTVLHGGGQREGVVDLAAAGVELYGGG
ncbi:hypothetical protein E2562_009889 [Oryza meyeriana var. granulata]|uniref:Uncharacterized protein n=1 Tax=Oryza meyeriana var. granulata TaxID=110450 RepID=A0A6G1BUA9_9ORYZ|nr:hypothetical protein E2562_009889 [Oryza meyeriana var. granulata]